MKNLISFLLAYHIIQSSTKDKSLVNKRGKPGIYGGKTKRYYWCKENIIIKKNIMFRFVVVMIQNYNYIPIPGMDIFVVHNRETMRCKGWWEKRKKVFFVTQWVSIIRYFLNFVRGRRRRLSRILTHVTGFLLFL